LAALAIVFTGAGAVPAGTFEGFSLTASAADAPTSGTCGENLTWTLDSEGTLTISGTGNFENYQWKTSPWYNIRKEIKKIIIKSGVTSIGKCAFCYCASLTSITIPDSVTSIGENAFYYCTSLTSVTIPDGVTSIANQTFYNCTSLKSITLPDSVTSIGAFAFRDCESLESIKFPDSVTTIGVCAFGNCKSLSSIAIPDSVTSISNSAFCYCTSLESIIIPDSVTFIDRHAFHDCTSLKSVTIPYSVKRIDEEAFGYYYYTTSSGATSSKAKKDKNFTITGNKCTAAEKYANENGFKFIALKAVILDSGECGENLTWELDSEGTLTITGTGDIEKSSSGEIPWNSRKSDINQIIINSGVTGIGNGAFYGCTNVKSVTIPDGVTRIGRFAFECCSKLESVTIPDGVTRIGRFAFWDCSKLESIAIPDSVTTISNGAFHSCGLKNITIPDSVTSIGISAFAYCKSLESVSIPDSVKGIGNQAFDCCTSLKSITVPGRVKTIGEKAFGYYYDNGYKKVDGFTIKGHKGTAVQTYANENGFDFIALDSTGKYPVVTSGVNEGQFDLKWTSVQGAEGYGLAVYQSGKWRIKEQFEADVTAYTSPKMKAGTYKMAICAKVNGEWNTSSLNQRAFTVTIA
jgi:hypothetical protein